MAQRRIRIAMNGVTGELGREDHLAASLLAIAREGGLPLANGDRLIPEPVLLGRNAEKLAHLSALHGGLPWSTDIAHCLTDPATEIYFDVAATGGRVARAREAIARRKHIYLEKPIAGSFDDALALAREAEAAGLKNGVVQDKLFLPGFQKLRRLRDMDFFGRILSARLDFGWWVFDGEHIPAGRSSWNYRKADGGGLILDMFPHWCYLIETLIGRIKSVSCRALTRTPRRWDETGKAYDVDVEDEVFATAELEDGILVQIASSWATRVRGDKLMCLQIDGTQGSGVASLTQCHAQSLAFTPRPIWDTDGRNGSNANAQWQVVPDLGTYKNSYRCGWELFLRHVAEDAPFPSPLLSGARGLQLIEACHASNRERRWVDLAKA